MKVDRELKLELANWRTSLSVASFNICHAGKFDNITSLTLLSTLAYYTIPSFDMR